MRERQGASRRFRTPPAVRQATEEKELDRLADYTKTKSGLRKLKHILRAARPPEQRAAA